MTPGRRAELAEAYARTLYRVDGAFTIAVGGPCPEARPWAFLTACNPGSEPLPDAENARRTEALKAALAGWEVYPGESTSPEGEWREASFFVVGIDEAAAADVARRFGQLAFVCGDGGAARLVWVG